MFFLRATRAFGGNLESYLGDFSNPAGFHYAVFIRITQTRGFLNLLSADAFYVREPNTHMACPKKGSQISWDFVKNLVENVIKQVGLQQQNISPSLVIANHQIPLF